MTQYLIMSRSLTNAQRASRLLEQSGIRATVVKAPQQLRGNGCGYALALKRSFPEAVRILRDQNLLFGKLYEKAADGEYTEVFL